MTDLLGAADPQRLLLALLIFIGSLALLIGLCGAIVIWAFTRNLERDEEQTLSRAEHEALKADRARMNAFDYPKHHVNWNTAKLGAEERRRLH